MSRSRHRSFGPEPDVTVLKTLQDALQAARSIASVPPVGVRLDSCVQFVERARRRLAKVEEDFNRVQEERAGETKFGQTWSGQTWS